MTETEQTEAHLRKKVVCAWKYSTRERQFLWKWMPESLLAAFPTDAHISRQLGWVLGKVHNCDFLPWRAAGARLFVEIAIPDHGSIDITAKYLSP